LLRGRRWLRGAAGALFVVLAAMQIVRNTIVSDGDYAPSLGSAVWPAHPNVLRLRIMGDVAQAGIQGRPPTSETLDRLQLLASEEPLSAEPYLVEAAVAVRNADYRRAEMLLLEARHREPRSPAARFLLADLYLRTGRALPAMRQMAVLNRLVPAGAAGLAPALAAYARTGGAVPDIRSIILAYPELEAQLLAQLATDTRNTDLILRLAQPHKAPPDPNWQQILLAKLIEQGAYARAHRLWTKFTGVPPQQAGLFNPGFSSSKAAPPFNWELSYGSGGVADAKSGGLDVLYFGRDDLTLARQITLLPPGRYRLAMRISGAPADARSISWRVLCLPGKQRVLDLPLQKAGAASGEFTVPGGECSAQSIELAAEGQEFPERSEFRISGLQLTRVPGA
jgi:hypothetical protein